MVRSAGASGKHLPHAAAAVCHAYLVLRRFGEHLTSAAIPRMRAPCPCPSLLGRQCRRPIDKCLEHIMLVCACRPCIVKPDLS